MFETSAPKWCLAAGLVLALGPVRATDQTQGNHWPGEQGLTWASIAKLPNWSGLWVPDPKSFRESDQAISNPKHNPYSAPLTPKWEAYRLAHAAAPGGFPPGASKANAALCLPDGMPALMQAPHGFEFFYAPGRVAIVAENGEMRHIYTDAGAHPDDPDDTWEGDSIGHWEGDTLVVDTIAIKPEAEIFMGLPNASDKTHVVERIHLNAQREIEVDTVVTNPDEFTKPFVYTRTWQSQPGRAVEYVCLEGNRATSAGTIDLTPPSGL